MKNNNHKKAALARLNKMKYYIRRFGVLKGSCKVLLPTFAAMALNISNVQAQEKYSDDNGNSRKVPEGLLYNFPERENDLLAYESKVVYDINAEVAKRADWFVSQFLEAAKKHLDNITSCSNKQAYVKKNFFDVVSPVRHLPGSTPYCITALNRALIDANNIGGDLTGVLPDPNTQECYAANECNAFADFMRKKGFGDCIDNGTINYSKLEPGDIILTPRNQKGNKHATQYIGKKDGKHYILSFNIDGIRELKNSYGIVIHMKKLTHKAILRNLEKEKLIDNTRPFDTILPMEQARRIQSFLLRGRPDMMMDNANTNYMASENAGHKKQPQPQTLSLQDLLLAVAVENEPEQGKKANRHHYKQNSGQPQIYAVRRRDEYNLHS